MSCSLIQYLLDFVDIEGKALWTVYWSTFEEAKHGETRDWIDLPWFQVGVGDSGAEERKIIPLVISAEESILKFCGQLGITISSV